MKMLKELNIRIAIVLVAVALTLLVVRISRISSQNSDDTQVRDPEVERYEKFEDYNDSLQSSQDSIIVSLDDSIAVLKLQIETQNKKLRQKKASHYENLNRINSLSTADINKYLSNRYKDRITE